MKAEFYEINIGNKSVGYFSIFNNDKITQFYVMDEYLNLTQQIFKEALDNYSIKTAFVSTSDQLFLSLCLDFHKKIELQAYFFKDIAMRNVRKPEYGRECLSLVKSNELDEINKKTSGFFNDVSMLDIEKGIVKMYRLYANDKVLGYGIIVPNKLLTQYWACGIITLENERQKGVGRSIQIHLGAICRENGYIPISGCWYHNHLSKKTIESAGRYSKTRLLNIFF